ncbi:MAG: O-antigen ligase family protein [Terriglobia bacterium]
MYLLLVALFILLGAILLYSRVRAHRFWLVLLVLTLPIASVNEVGGVEVNFSLSDTVMIGLLLHAVTLSAVAKRTLRLPLLGLITPFFLWVLISMMIGVNRFGSGSNSLYIISLGKFIALFGYFFAVVNLVRSHDDFRLFLRTWLVTSTLVGTLGIIGSLLYITTGTTTPFNEGFRAHGTLDEANLFAAYSLLSFFLGVALLTGSSEGRARLWILLSMSVQVLAIVFSASRGATVAFLLSALALAIVCGSLRLRLAMLAAAAMPVLLFFTIPLASPEVRGKLDLVVNRLASAQDLESRAHVQRYFLWTHAVSLFEENPLFGVGSGNYKAIIANDREMRLTKTAHNTFLRILSETGLVGLLLFLAFLSYSAGILLRRIARRRTVAQAPMAACLLAGLIAIAIHGLASDFGNFRGFWTLLGLIYAFHAFSLSTSQPHSLGHAI